MKKSNGLGINISNKRQSSVRNTTFSKTIPKQKQNLLPIISIQPLVPNTYNYLYNQNNKFLFSDDILKKIKTYFNNDNEYYSLINKINNIENNGNNGGWGEKINYGELKKYNTQFDTLDKRYLLNFDGKEINNNEKMMNYKLNTLKDENKLQNKKIEELQNHLDNIKNIGKEKDKEITTLLNKIGILKKELKMKDK